MNLPRPLAALRWVLAGCAGVTGVGVAVRLLAVGGDGMPGFARLMLVLATLLVGVVAISPELVGWAVRPMHRVLDSIFLPSESEPPPVDFTLARYYLQRWRYEEACEEYSQIIRYHPRETAAYLGGIYAAGQLGDEALVQKYYRGAQRIMRSREQRAVLENLYAVRHALPVAPPEEDTAPETAPSQE